MNIIRFISLNICLLIINPFLFSQESERIDNSNYEFLRITDQALQTPIYTLVNKNTTVRLKVIGVIHIADSKYYHQLRTIINDLDILFYEGIRMSHLTNLLPIAVATTDNGKEDVNTFSKIQTQLAESFKFAQQADHLRPQSNWINADVNFQEFSRILQKINLSLEDLSKNLSLDNRNIFEYDSEARNYLNNEKDQTKILLWAKKRMAVYLLKSANELCYNEELKLPREAIIIERNKVAVNYLKQRFNSQNPSEIGLLYGAAHIPHFIDVLQREHEFEISSIEWIDAWSLISNQ
jgi:hypothetical protein